MAKLICFTCKLILLAMLLAAPTLAQERPNLIWIMADDLGYGDLGCYGQQVITTPSIDRMAREGLRFTQFYAGATVCAPSRSVLMTDSIMDTRVCAAMREPRIRKLKRCAKAIRPSRKSYNKPAIVRRWWANGVWVMQGLRKAACRASMALMSSSVFSINPMPTIITQIFCGAMRPGRLCPIRSSRLAKQALDILRQRCQSLCR